MNIQGFCCTVSNDNEFYVCHFGVYEGDFELILKAKLWNKTVPIHHLISYLGVVQRNENGTLYIDVKDFVVIGPYQEGVMLVSAIHAHGIVESGQILSSKSWYFLFNYRHGKERAMTGNFKTNFIAKPNDLVF
jgi:hypothetical protein